MYSMGFMFDVMCVCRSSFSLSVSRSGAFINLDLQLEPMSGADGTGCGGFVMGLVVGLVVVLWWASWCWWCHLQTILMGGYPSDG